MKKDVVYWKKVIHMKANDPIGVFDSGLGGLSVVTTLRQMLPHENIVYFGDSARNPYGTKPKQQVRDYCFEIVEHLKQKSVKAIVIACNTATSVAANDLRKQYPELDIIGMEPALKPAATMKTPSTIAVWATDLTLKEDKFKHLMERYEQDHTIIRVACPKLVELVEQDALDQTELVDRVLQGYLDQCQGAEFIVLGCTHFLFYKERLLQLIDKNVQVIDGNAGTVNRVRFLLDQKNLLNQDEEGNLSIENSDSTKLELSEKLVKKMEGKHE